MSYTYYELILIILYVQIIVPSLPAGVMGSDQGHGVSSFFGRLVSAFFQRDVWCPRRLVSVHFSDVWCQHFSKRRLVSVHFSDVWCQHFSKGKMNCHRAPSQTAHERSSGGQGTSTRKPRKKPITYSDPAKPLRRFANSLPAGLPCPRFPVK
jgi:hypothetical protein